MTSQGWYPLFIPQALEKDKQKERKTGKDETERARDMIHEI